MVNNAPSLSDYVRKLNNGEGLGIGAGYKPWLDARSTKTHGVSSQTFGIKTGRIHHGLSTNEKNFLYIIEYHSTVTDIREQFPLLPLHLSVRMSEALGIKHPKVPSSKINNIITTDFLITYTNNGKNEYAAFSVKPENGLKSLRDLEKQELERVWWETLGIPWKIFINDSEAQVVANNIRWISQPLRDGRWRRIELLESIWECIEVGPYELNYLFCMLSDQLGMSEFEVNEIFRVLVWCHFIELDLEIDILGSGIVNILSKQQISSQSNNYGIASK